MSADAIGVKVGKAVNRHKVGKHFILTIQDNLPRFERDEASIAREAQLDGIYIVRTSEPAEALSAGDTYKSLGQLEQAFRCMKSVDLRVRPVRDRSEAHVRAHIFFCMLAYDDLGTPLQEHLPSRPRQNRNPIRTDDRACRLPKARLQPARLTLQIESRYPPKETKGVTPFSSLELPASPACGCADCAKPLGTVLDPRRCHAPEGR
ncbi:MAG: hypothetical protein R6W89_03775 [Candidatus Hydrogenedentota bacterium]